MKREIDSQVSAVHEAGHIIIANAQDNITPGESLWAREGFTFTEVAMNADWESLAGRSLGIAGQSAVALAGGVAEAIFGGGLTAADAPIVGIDDVIEACGRIDYELAQEWLGMQRHDPDRETVRDEAVRIFRSLLEDLAQPSCMTLLGSVSQRVERLRSTSTGDVHWSLTDDEIDHVLLAGIRGTYPLTVTHRTNLTAVTTE